MMALGKPVYRCLHKDNPNQMFQFGPGLLSVNFVGSNYEWSNFLAEVIKVVNAFMSVYQFNDEKQLGLNLKYVDFFPYNFAARGDILQFLSDKFHVDIKADFLKDLRN